MSKVVRNYYDKNAEREWNRLVQDLSQLQSFKFYAYFTLCSIVLVQKKNWDKDN
ncbi:MAG: hypothetical protein OEX77_07520 [Candidatus Bathyarchaeota archaeon]|nr:hypothetical protein [Candidatus Bathyarchaeota archaeon]